MSARALYALLTLAAALFVAFQLLTPIFGYYPNLVQRATHMGFGVAIAVGTLVAARLETGRRVGWLESGSHTISQCGSALRSCS